MIFEGNFSANIGIGNLEIDYHYLISQHHEKLESFQIWNL